MLQVNRRGRLKPKQLDMLPKNQHAYGGSLRSTRKGRTGPRAISTKYSMHLVLRSTRAVGAWSFRKHDLKIKAITQKFSVKYGVKILSLANAGNHLHMQIQLTTRHTYKAFIRALTGAIAMAVTGASRWQPLKTLIASNVKINTSTAGFWDYRPFSRIVIGFKALLTLKDYIQINRLEGHGYDRNQARLLIAWSKDPPKIRSRSWA
jgi:putative transposase